jgi:uncharacterized protein
MTDEERRLIAGFVERVAGANRQGPQPASAWKVGQAAPGPDQQPLPPVDPEADRLLAELFTRHPEARYRLTQTAFVQEHALAETQNRIQQLEYELERTRREAQAAQSQPKGILGGLFGGGGQPAPQQPMPPPPRPVHAPGYQPGMFGQQQQGRGGMGFLGTAGAAVAGVAGGMLAANAISGLMGGGGHGTAHAAESPAASPLPGPEGTSGWGQAPQQDDGAGWGDEER